MSQKRKRDMDEILKSKQIKFVVGPEEEEYTVHLSSLAALSTQLKSILYGLDGGEKKIVWKNVQPATFVNLMEYAYSRHYTVPTLFKPTEEEQVGNKHTNAGTKSSTSNLDRSVPEPEEHESLASWMVTVSQNQESRQHTSAQYKFCLEHFPLDVENEELSASATSTRDWLADIMQQNRTGIKEVFLAHANLWLLADQYGIAELKDLCLYRLQQSLLHSPGSDEMLHAVLETIRVVYSSPWGSSGSALRTLLCHFCLTDMEWMMRHKDLGTLLKSVPGLSTDLFLEVPQDYWRELRDGGSA
ncbi:hypothetical protein CT0861_03409 [Colletotrichum tofieldiae]|uniref:BTB domain-containing protein n=1 Tax=Colletotrichum tofieldiae TaxID=708197 RepID=A0A166X853_9PEZI|nr:hypothetical protein CT0861_03409 [Colletotrichum tofieldiae]